VFDAPGDTGYERAVRRAVQRVVAERLMGLAEQAPMAEVRAHATVSLERISRRAPGDAYGRVLARDIERFLERPGHPAASPSVPAPAAPPGSPIGVPASDWR